MGVRTDYLSELQKDKTQCKVFLNGGAMLTGIITKFDDECFIIDKCLVDREQVISTTPK